VSEDKPRQFRPAEIRADKLILKKTALKSDRNIQLVRKMQDGTLKRLMLHSHSGACEPWGQAPKDCKLRFNGGAIDAVSAILPFTQTRSFRVSMSKILPMIRGAVGE